MMASIAVDPFGNVYVTGSTESTDFPTVNPYQDRNAGGLDAYVTKLLPTDFSFNTPSRATITVPLDDGLVTGGIY